MPAELAAALAQYQAATPAQQQQWASAYDAAVTKLKSLPSSGLVPLPAAGPVPVMMAYELKAAQAGSIDADLLAHGPWQAGRVDLREGAVPGRPPRRTPPRPPGDRPPRVVPARPLLTPSQG